jgi:hypothetical protein
MRSQLTDIDPSQPLTAYPGKTCGGCTACCVTVPVKEIGLAAFTRCPHLRSPPELATGCGIYQTRPRSCRQWSCSWLISDLPDKYKPSRIGIVIDPVPDMVRFNGKDIPAAQFWVLPGHEEDYRTVDEVRDLIWSVFDLGFVVLWRIRAEEGRQKARVMMRREGKMAVSEAEYGQKEIEGFANDGERLIHAQKLADRRR